VLGDELDEAEPPDIEPWLYIVWQAFEELSPQRPVGFEVGAIPHAAIFTYLDEFLPLTEREDRIEFARLIGVLDRAFLEKAREKQKPKKNAALNR
jgi:hypothetical protein